MTGDRRQRRTNRSLRFCVAAILAFVFPVVLTSLLAQEPKLPPAKDVVKPNVYVSLDKVPRGRAFDVAVVAEIMPGFHVNSNKPLEDYLIPTQLLPALPAGFKVLSATYPPGKLTKFDFSEKKLSVYEGTFTLRMRIQAPSGAPLGKTTLPLTLRYQACNDFACLPPVKIPVALEIDLAAAGAAARPTHPQIFRK